MRHSYSLDKEYDKKYSSYSLTQLLIKRFELENRLTKYDSSNLWFFVSFDGMVFNSIQKQIDAINRCIIKL